MKVIGIIQFITPVVYVGQNNSPKKTMRIQTVSQYPDIYDIDFFGDRSDLPDVYKQGDAVEVDINLKGKLWVNGQGKEMNILSLNGWGIRRQGQQAQQQPAQQQGQNFQQNQQGQQYAQQGQQGNYNQNNQQQGQFQQNQQFGGQQNQQGQNSQFGGQFGFGNEFGR